MLLIERCQKKLIILVKQYKLRSYRTYPDKNMCIKFPVTISNLWSCTKGTVSLGGAIKIGLICYSLTNMTHLRALVNIPRHQWYTRRYGSI